MFWDRPADHVPTEAEQDLAKRMTASERTIRIAMAMIAADRAPAPKAPGATVDAAPMAAVDPDDRYPVVYVGLALPGKTYGIWTHGQPVEEAPGFFLTRTREQGRDGREHADAAAGRALAGRSGTSAYARIDGDGLCAVWEGIYGSDDGTGNRHG